MPSPGDRAIVREYGFGRARKVTILQISKDGALVQFKDGTKALYHLSMVEVL